MTFNNKTYGALLAETLPGVVKTQAEFDRLAESFNRLITRGENNLSPEEFRLYELLADLLEDFEKRTLPELEPALTGAAALQFLMTQNDLVQTDLEDLFGSQSNVSKVLKGKRPISRAAAIKLSQRFKVSTDFFLKDE